jgi:hypothetical protein
MSKKEAQRAELSRTPEEQAIDPMRLNSATSRAANPRRMGLVPRPELESWLTRLSSRDVGSNDWLECFMRRMKFISQTFALNRLKRHKTL